MTERSFRITQKQLDSLGSLMASKAPGSIILATCGHGIAKISYGTERESWSYIGDEKVYEISALEAFSFDKSNFVCIAAQPDELSEVAFDFPNCIWVGISEDGIAAYYWSGKLIPVEICEIVGHSLNISSSNETLVSKDFSIRTRQAFGKGTTKLLSSLTIGIAGVSGTGSIVAEQLFRLGVKRLVLVDDDSVEEVNLGRILYASKSDTLCHKNKAEMLKEKFDRMGLDCEIIAVPTVITGKQALRCLSQCDILFGCLDSADGRMQLNRIGTFYTIPVIDVGVKLVSEEGKLSEISTAVRYIIPGEASLFSLGVYSTEQLQSESLRRADPIAYQERLKEKYIIGAQESAPAVISINMMAASCAVVEFLNRVHCFRDTPNEEVEVISCNLLEPYYHVDAPSAPDFHLAKYLGQGDYVPFLDMPFLGDVPV